jgi:hypothetical protein
VKYLKGILVGAAVSAITVIIFSVTSVGEFYAVDFPLWPVVTVGLLVFAIAFGWTLRRASP